MAAEESTRASAAGPVIPASGGDAPPGGPDLSALSEILGEFADALCILEVICIALEASGEEPPESVMAFAVSLRQGLILINRAYERFDLALVELHEDDPPDDPDAAPDSDPDDGWAPGRAG